MYTGNGTQRNIATYRIEQNVNDSYGVYYSKRTGNIFTNDITYSKKKAEEWKEQGFVVWTCLNNGERIA